MTFIQIDNKVKELKPIEAFVLGFLISRKGKSVSLGLLAKVCSGEITAKTKATASKYVHTLEDKGFIQITQYDGKVLNKYSVYKGKGNFVEINYDMFLPEYNNISAKAKGLFIKMATMAYKDSGLITKTEKEIYTELGISENTYYKLRKELIESGMIENKQLSKVWFRIAKKAKKDYKQLFYTTLEEVKAIANNPKNEGLAKRYKNQLIALKGYMETMPESTESYKYGYEMLIRIQSDTFKNQKSIVIEL